ncbi:hypothetical protein LTR97_012169 [Elasticomyces elasticus]|uniref:Uncharacterized protein n=1 Tax=Elasticomyces elasticus TaxID=574655 RepID=A0AAN7VM71_9PEZI|nr:hypothetical protein LTR97_012169 [Elasticomyces elasticus]
MVSSIQPSDSMRIGLETTAKDGSRNDETPVKHRLNLTDFPHELPLKIFGYVIAEIHYQAEYVKPMATSSGFALAARFASHPTTGDYPAYKWMMARLLSSKYIYKVVKEAYFTQRRFFLCLQGCYPPDPPKQPMFPSGGYRHPGRRNAAVPPSYFFGPDRLGSSHTPSVFGGSTFADQAIYYDSVMNLSVIISPTQLTDALTLASQLALVLERCREVASMNVLFTQGTPRGCDTVVQGDEAAISMIKGIVAEYGERVNKMVRVRWLTDDVLHLLQ